MTNSSYRLTAILFGIGVTLHNLEEAMFLVDWALLAWEVPIRAKPQGLLGSDLAGQRWDLDSGGGRLRFEGEFVFQNALTGFALAMAINAVLPHLMISLVTHSYSPGVERGGSSTCRWACG